MPGMWNAYDYYPHLRTKHLPRTDLSGLKLQFDIEYDHALDGAMRLDAAKFASVSWDSMCFECGVGGEENIYQVRLPDHAVAIGGAVTPARVRIEMTGEEPAAGLDWLHCTSATLGKRSRPRTAGSRRNSAPSHRAMWRSPLTTRAASRQATRSGSSVRVRTRSRRLCWRTAQTPSPRRLL